MVKESSRSGSCQPRRVPRRALRGVLGTAQIGVPPSFDLEAQGNPDFAEAELESPEGFAHDELSVAAPQYRKQGFSIYTMMLIISFLCLLATWIIMYVEVGPIIKYHYTHIYPRAHPSGPPAL